MPGSESANMKGISAFAYPLLTIFSKNFDYHIPPYQRPYSWGESQTETLIENLYDFYTQHRNDEKVYFLGSVVLMERNGQYEYDVIDGQQRLTTLTILLSVLASKMQNPARDDFYRFYIVEPGNEFEGLEKKTRLHLRTKDQEFFEEYVQGGKIDDLLNYDVSRIDNDSQLNIRQNCKIMYDAITSYFGDNEGALKDFSSFIVKRCSMVVVTTSDLESAYTIFSVMNSTGLNLSATDIIKSDVIGKINGEDKQQVYTDKWEDTEIEVSRSGFLDLFYYIRMIVTKRKADKSLLEEFRENVMAKRSPEKLIDDVIVPYARCYAKIKAKSFGTGEIAEKINHSSLL